MSVEREHGIVAIAFNVATWSIFDEVWLWLLYSSVAILVVLACYFVERKCAVCAANDQQDNVKNGYIWTKLGEANRSTESFGLWCTFLLPATLFASTGYKIDFLLVAMFQLPIFLFVLSNALTSKILLPAFLLGSIICFVFNLAVLKWVLYLDWFLSSMLGLIALFVGVPLSMYIFCKVPKSFTFGEFTVIWQAMLLALVKSITELVQKGSHLDTYSCIIFLGYLACFCLVWSCFLSKTFWPNLIVVFFVVLIVSYVTLDQDMIVFMVNFLSKNYRRICVLMFWLLCVFCTLHFVSYAWQRPKLTTVHRKFFHLTISLVLLSGLLYDPELLLLASVLMFYLFIVIEIVRLLNVQPLGDGINSSFTKFLDEQDQGPLVLTPIYLLVGSFLPLWLAPVTKNLDIQLYHFSGFISVGVGDAVASIGGSLIGKTKWFDKKKTVEGTSLSVFAQILALAFVLYFVRESYEFDVGNDLYLIICCVVISLLETFTCQVDNLVLSLVSFILFFKVK